MGRVTATPRSRFGEQLTGEVLEIGPGHEPFPVAAGARVTYADKKVPGGRDETWPELVGSPHGPDADVAVDLDAEGLRAFADGSFDAVIAAHVLEHLADPIAALGEIGRVLRDGGVAAIVLPDRLRTFDRVREPTSLAHLLEEHGRGVTQVDEQHIRQFCEAIWQQEPFHPEPVRGWHDPSELDPERVELHRRRSIHVHCWSAGEFAVLTAGVVRGGAAWELLDQFVAEDSDPPSMEFGLLLRKSGGGGSGAARELLRRWATGVAGGGPGRHAVLADLTEAAARDLTSGPVVVPGAARVPLDVLSRNLCDLAARVGELEADRERWRRQVDALEVELAAVRSSRTWRVGRLMARPVGLLRSWRGG